MRIPIAFLSRTMGIPDKSDGTGGSTISYRVRIVLSCPVDDAQSCSTSAHSSGRRQYSSTDRVCFGGSYTAVPLPTISATMNSRYGGSKRRLILSFRSISSQSLPGFSASSTLMVKSLRCRAYDKMSLDQCCNAVCCVIRLGCCVKNGGDECIEGNRYPDGVLCLERLIMTRDGRRHWSTDCNSFAQK